MTILALELKSLLAFDNTESRLRNARAAELLGKLLAFLFDFVKRKIC